MDAPRQRNKTLSDARRAAATRRLVRKRADKGVSKQEALLKETQRVAETALYIGLGAALLAWDAAGKIYRSFYRRGGAAPLPAPSSDKRSAKSGKIKVPILPIDHYDKLEIDQIIEALSGLSEMELDLVRRYEAANQNREPLIRLIAQRMAGAKR